ncbi:MAG TPA: ATP12 family protein [Magnetospirillaceae bacterium]|jgi:chaperone required for assembly of F1-ATPase
MKRFYKTAAIQREGEGHAVTLDGKPVKTPMRKSLALPNAKLADAVAGEWAAQGETIEPPSMPLTSIANTAIDRIAAAREDMVAGLLRYAETDLLCYRAEGPADLVARQTAIWQAILDWAAVGLGATLATTVGIIPIAQPEDALAKLRNVLRVYDDFRLAALSTAVSATGSLILGLALAEGRLTAAEAFAAAQLDETYQNEFWGEDEETVQRRAARRADIEAAAQVFGLLSS